MNNIYFRAVLTLCVGGVGGALFDALHLPLPWLLGALIAAMIASLAGAPVEIKSNMRKYLVVVLGVMLGGTFTPDILIQAPAWVPTLIAAVVYLVILTLVAQIYCRKIMKMDKITATFAGMPGGLSEMVILGEEHGANAHTLTLTHAVRVAAVLVSIPFFINYWSGIQPTAHPLAHELWTVRDIAILIASAGIGVWFGKIARLPAHFLTGPLLISAAVHLSGLVTNDPPLVVRLCIQITMGSAMGARFYGVSIKSVGRLMSLALGMAVMMMSVTLLSAATLAPLTGFSFESLVLALSPGGFAEMALAALSMNINPAFVTTHHAVRLFVVVFIAPVLLSHWIKRTKSP